jgi:hypothetical protein
MAEVLAVRRVLTLVVMALYDHSSTDVLVDCMDFD